MKTIHILLLCILLIGCGSSPVMEIGNNSFDSLNEDGIAGANVAINSFYSDRSISTPVYDETMTEIVGREEDLKDIPYPPKEDMILPTALSLDGAINVINHLLSVIRSGHSVTKDYLDFLNDYLREGYEAILTAGPNNVKKGYHVQCRQPNLYQFDKRVAPIRYVIDSDTGHLIPCGPRSVK